MKKIITVLLLAIPALSYAESAHNCNISISKQGYYKSPARTIKDKRVSIGIRVALKNKGFTFSNQENAQFQLERTQECSSHGCIQWVAVRSKETGKAYVVHALEFSLTDKLGSNRELSSILELSDLSCEDGLVASIPNWNEPLI